MGEMISKYATEGGKKEGKPNGKFWFEYEEAQKAGVQVLKDYLHLNDEQAKEVICQNIEETWQHFDVNQTGMIEADRMPNFFQMLVGHRVMLNIH